MNNCESCKYYEKCSANIYVASIERQYIIYEMGGDCWEERDEN